MKMSQFLFLKIEMFVYILNEMFHKNYRQMPKFTVKIL